MPVLGDACTMAPFNSVPVKQGDPPSGGQDVNWSRMRSSSGGWSPQWCHIRYKPWALAALREGCGGKTPLTSDQGQQESRVCHGYRSPPAWGSPATRVFSLRLSNATWPAFKCERSCSPTSERNTVQLLDCPGANRQGSWFPSR